MTMDEYYEYKKTRSLVQNYQIKKYTRYVQRFKMIDYERLQLQITKKCKNKRFLKTFARIEKSQKYSKVFCQFSSESVFID